MSNHMSTGYHKDKHREHRGHWDRKWSDCGGKDWGKNECHEWEKKDHCKKW